ncbi:MAG: hypothetical protein D6691_12205 [Candidatus Hydrogenedentota bacterium]|uniref:Uncharacterized protein n=1 Tax=Sumerlaea chitinivorans TaxID=2250252 RepID=A0A2Z4Y9P5_SUMC1|nr:hypothetical protein BRCON_2640 [Candidatus Sumerlaea chitinivorans]RMH24068.1 MAG: hypothetical protein D6691_12205 [Candidatus Hydrogenedentota bacterium]
MPLLSGITIIRALIGENLGTIGTPPPELQANEVGKTPRRALRQLPFVSDACRILKLPRDAFNSIAEQTQTRPISR